MVWIQARLAWLAGDHDRARNELAQARKSAGSAWEPDLEGELTAPAPVAAAAPSPAADASGRR